MSVLKVAVLQMTASGSDWEKNFAKAQGFCREAKDADADIVLFPEMWSNGYRAYAGEEHGPENMWKGMALTAESPYIQCCRALARELNMAIGATYLQAWSGPPRNALALIDRHGEIVLTYAKVHTCDFTLVEASLTPGDDFFVADLDTAAGPVRVGAMICFDFEFPESARILMLRGAEILLVPTGCDLNPLRHGQLQARAYENALCVVTTNHGSFGHSIVFNVDGTKILECGKGDETGIASFDLERVRDYRRKTIWGNAYRRPQRYGPLISLDVAEPFVRSTGLGEPFDRANR